MNIIFDFDGTICDSRDQAIEVYNDMAKRYKYKSIDPANLPDLMKLSVLQAARALNVPAYRLPFLMKEGRDMFAEKMKELSWISGMHEAVKILQEQGVRLFLVSTNSKRNIMNFLASGPNPFESIHSNGIFGKKAGIRKVMSKFGLDPAEVWYVGDEIRDVEAGKGAGVKTAAASWGYNSPEALKSAAPDLFLSSPSDLPKILSK
jgi:phosphoglycolate phosphatase